MDKRGPYKSQTLETLRQRGVPVGTILDVGVCHGTPELVAVWPDVPHILFEPVEEFEPKIRHHYRNVSHELHIVAVGAEDGTVGLRTTSVLEGMGISHSSMVEGAGERSVPRVSLDSYLGARKTEAEKPVDPFLLKIDIDGHEMQVIQGATETLRRCSIVIVECQARQLAQRVAAVQSAGFTLFDLAEPCYYDKMFWQCDAVFIRDDLVSGRFEQLTGKVTPGMYETFR